MKNHLLRRTVYALVIYGVVMAAAHAFAGPRIVFELDDDLNVVSGKVELDAPPTTQPPGDPAPNPVEPEVVVVVDENSPHPKLTYTVRGVSPDEVEKVLLIAYPTYGVHYPKWSKEIPVAGTVGVTVADLKEAWPDVGPQWEVTFYIRAVLKDGGVLESGLYNIRMSRATKPNPEPDPNKPEPVGWRATGYDYRVEIPPPPANALKPRSIEEAQQMLDRNLRPILIDGDLFTDKSPINRRLIIEGNRDVWVTNLTFVYNESGWPQGCAIWLIDCDEIFIYNNTFTVNGDPKRGGASIGSHKGIQDVYIANNDFIGVHEGVHTRYAHSTEGRIRVLANYFSGIDRMGIELQDGGDTHVVDRNYYHKPRMINGVPANAPTVFGISAVTNEAKKGIVTNNIVVGDTRASVASDKTRLGMAIEAGARDLIANNNLILDWLGCNGYSILSNHDRSLPRTRAIITNSVITGVPDKGGIGWASPIGNDGGSIITIGENVVINNKAGTYPIPPKPADVGRGGYKFFE